MEDKTTRLTLEEDRTLVLIGVCFQTSKCYSLNCIFSYLKYYTYLHFSFLLKEYFPTKVDAHYVKAAEGFGGITKHELNFYHTTLNIIHIGDQRYSSPTIKWRRFPCFENAESILFLVSCISYDQFLTDGTTNCLVDSCDFFDRIINSFFFAHKSVILFFTKADILEEKIKHSNIKDYFPEFQGDPRKLEDVQSFIFQMFNDRRRENSRALFRGHHFMTTSDPENITFLFHIIRDTYPCKACLYRLELL